MIVSCAQILKKKGYSIQYKIFGDGPKRAEILQEIHDAGLDGIVHLMGCTSKLFEEYNQAYIYVMISNFEGMPNALMEAMALGLPCISMDSPPGGARMLIQNEYNGLLVPVGSKREVVNGMKRIANDDCFAKYIGENAAEIRKRVDEYAICNEWKKLIAGS